MVCFYFAREQAGIANTVESFNLTSKGNHQKKKKLAAVPPDNVCIYITRISFSRLAITQGTLPGWGNANIRFGNPNNETILG
jgi:hypothetical protein